MAFHALPAIGVGNGAYPSGSAIFCPSRSIHLRNSVMIFRFFGSSILAGVNNQVKLAIGYTRSPGAFVIDLEPAEDEIARVVTLQTSGTTGPSKRLFFTANDLEATVDFFHHGMATMVEPGATVIIFLPGELPDSVGDLPTFTPSIGWTTTTRCSGPWE